MKTIGLLLLLLLGVGCSVNGAFVDSMDQIRIAVEQDYAQFVLPNLTGEEKDIRLNTLLDWKRLIEEARR